MTVWYSLGTDQKIDALANVEYDSQLLTTLERDISVNTALLFLFISFTERSKFCSTVK